MRSVLQVLQRNPFECIGGVESVSLSFDKALRDLEIEPGYLFVGNSESIQDDKTYILAYAFTLLSCVFGYFSPVSLVRFVRSFDGVVVHYPAPYLLLIITFTGIRFDVYYHSDIVRQKLSGAVLFPLIFLCFLRSRRIFVSSPNYADGSLMLRFLKKRIEILTPPGDESLLSTELNMTILSNIPKPFFLFLGADRSYKSIITIRQASNLVDDENLTFVLAGPGTERYTGPNLISLGWVDRPTKAALLSCCSGVIMVSNSRAEALGISLIEGLMFGKPLVTTRINSGPNYVNIDGVTGFHIAVGDAVALRIACCDLINGTIKNVEKNCISWYRQSFSFRLFRNKVALFLN